MKALWLLWLLPLLGFGCNHNLTSNPSYRVPEKLNDGIQVGTLEQARMDSSLILKASQRIENGKYGEVHSLLLYKEDRLVFEKYYRGHRFKWDAERYRGDQVDWTPEMLHQIMSCTKSVTSACIGIALDKEYISSVHQSVFDYLPDHRQYKTDGREGITIEHLLTMTSGLQWDEWHAPHATAANDIDRLYIECYEDPLSCVFERPLVSKPGEAFTYNGGGIIALGEILKHASGMDIVAFARQFLFEPLEIDTLQWDAFPKGEIETAGGLHLRPRDMLKFGITYLNEGTWNGEQILPVDWVKKSAHIYGNNVDIKIPIEDSGNNGYGYTWWISKVGKGKHQTSMYRTNGWGGQVIMVLPEKDMVVVFTGGNYTSKSKLFKILERYILTATD